MKKQIISIIVCIAFVFTILPIPVYAAEDSQEFYNESNAESSHETISDENQTIMMQHMIMKLILLILITIILIPAILITAILMTSILTTVILLLRQNNQKIAPKMMKATLKMLQMRLQKNYHYYRILHNYRAYKKLCQVVWRGVSLS